MRDLLIILLSVDVIFIFVYALLGVLRAAGVAPEMPYSLHLDAEMGLASVWNYAKFMATIAALALIWTRERGASLLIMVGLFLFLLVDDYYELHDRVGAALGENLSIEMLNGLHPQDKGEVFVYSAILAIAAPLLWLALVSARGPTRSFVIALMAGVILLGMFGVAVDVLHGVLKAILSAQTDLVQKIVDRLVIIFEDGGEMVAISACAWFCLVRLSDQAPDGA